jgi:hypothetical protein
MSNVSFKGMRKSKKNIHDEQTHGQKFEKKPFCKMSEVTASLHLGRQI